MNKYAQMADRLYDQEQQMKRLEEENAELKEENKELKRDKEDLIFIRNQKAKCMCKDKERLAYAKTIIQDLLNNSDEYVRQRAIDFLKEGENE